MTNYETIEAIKRELEKHRQKRRSIYTAIRVVDHLFSGNKDTCAKCGLIKDHVEHRPDEDHKYIPSIYVGDLFKSKRVYEIENICNIYITDKGLRIDVEEDTDEESENSLPSAWYEEVRINILSNLEQIIYRVLLALKEQNEELKVFDKGIEKVNAILEVLKN